MDVFKTLIHSQPGAVGSSVAITGGSINGTNIGATTPGTGAFTTLTASGVTTVTNATASTSTTSGALQVAGGASIVGTLYTGDQISVVRTTDAASYLNGLELRTGAGAGSFYPGIKWQDTSLGSMARIYAYRESGSFATSIVFQTSVSGSATPTTAMRIDSGQSVILSGTTASTSTTNGALQVAGGVGVAGAGYFGGSLVGTAAAAAGTYALAAISGDPRIYLRDSDGTAENRSWDFTNSGTTFVGRVLNDADNSASNWIQVARSNNTVGAVTLPGTTASTSTTTGALVVSGGIGAAGAANVGTYYGMVDGVTAPGATVGYAKIYVDTADGDLKVIFGDGTIKTLATDT